MRLLGATPGSRGLWGALLVVALLWPSVVIAQEAGADVEEEAPAEGEAESAEGEAEPAEGEAESAEGEAEPAEGEAESAEGTAEPASDNLPKCEVGKDSVEAQEEAAAAVPATAEEQAAAEEEKGVRAMFRDAVDRYARSAHDYQLDVHRVLQRSVDQQRDFIKGTYGKQSDDLEGELRERREEAIRRFERFVQQYPDNETYTPDAYFRLAELYFENSAVKYQDALEQFDKDLSLYERGKVPLEPREPEQSMNDSIRIYRTLLARFGDTYRYADAVYYLLGYVQSESGEGEEALQAWLTLVKRFPDSEFAPESYMRIGEEHFDMGDYARAGKYYKAAMGTQDSKYYDKALYKLGWTYFQVYDYHRAIHGFLDLIAFADKEGADSRASLLREEAVEYLALSLAEDDWDNDGLPDGDAGVKRALSYLSKGLPYERDIVERYAKALNDLADEKKFREAIVVYNYLIDQDPLAANAPGFLDQIIELHYKMQEPDKAYEANQRFATLFGPGTGWWESNKAEQKQRQHITESILNSRLDRAMHLNAKAMDLRNEAKMEANADKLAEAEALFRETANVTGDFIKDYPQHEDLYNLTAFRAEALWYSGQYGMAAAAYEEIARMPGDGEHRERSAWRWLESRKRIMAMLIQDGDLNPKIMPGSEWKRPEPEEEEEGAEDLEKAPVQNVKVEVEEVPEAALKWISSVDYILTVMQKEGQVDPAVVVIAYQVGEMMTRLNRLDEARTWFKQVISCYPKEEAAALSIAQIINTYYWEKDYDNLEKWGNLAEQMNLGDPEQVASIRQAIRQFKLEGQFRKANALMKEKKWVEAATEFERLGDENPDIPAVGDGGLASDIVYFNAAMAYKNVKRYDSAATLLERLVTEDRYSTSEFKEESLSVLAETYKQFFSFDKAISAFRTLHGRYREASEDERKYRLQQIATLYEAAGNYREAAQGYEAYVAAYPKEDISATYLKNTGDLYERLDDHRNMRRILRQFIKKYDKNEGDNKEVLDLWVIESHGKLRDLALKLGDKKAVKRIEERIMAEYHKRNVAPEGTLAWYGKVNQTPAELVAGIIFRGHEREWRLYKKIAVTSGNPKKITKVIQDKLKARGELEKKIYDLVPYNSLDWTIAVAYRAAQLYDDFAEMLLNIPEPPGLSDDELEQYEVMIEDLATPIEDKAIQLYEKAVLRARKLKVKNVWARRALESINKYKPNEFPLNRPLKTEIVPESLYTLDARAPEGTQ